LDNFHAQYFDWALFSNKQGPKNICYIVATTIKKSGKAQNRGEPYFIITKTAGKLPEVSVSSGYYYKEDSEIELSFGLKKFYMLTYESRAWTYSVDDDIEIIKAMKNSDSVIINATSNINISSQDTFSLIGFNKAYKALQEKCF
jgi:invasion protein IalB